MHWRELRRWLTNAQPNDTTREHHTAIRHLDEQVRTRVGANIPGTVKAARKEQG